MTQASRSANESWVLIVGASSGIGRAIAHHWAAVGSRLLLAGRDTQDLEKSAADLRIRHNAQVKVIPYEALDFAQYQVFWQNCLTAASGNLHGILLLHGSLPAQSDAQNDLNLLRRTIDTNYTSAAAILTLAANDFEREKRGFICVFSSVAGDRGRQSNYAYGAAKAGLSAFLSGLEQRLFKSGVTVLTVKPGFVDTAMTWGLPGMFLVAQPQRVAADVFRAVQRGRSEIYTPWFWRYIMLIIRCIPRFLFKRLKL